MDNNQNYFKFLGKLYDILIKEEIIQYNETPKDLKEKKRRVEKYLEKLQRVQDKSLENDRYLDMIKKLYYDRYIIKEEDIPTNYLNFLERQYLEQGHGHINLVNPQNNIDLQMREQHIKTIIRDQKDSLNNWLNYFLSKESSYLPMWSKVWAFQGMLHIGNLNQNKDGYDNRSKTTVNPFVSMDPEVLGKCVELITTSFNKQKITDEELDKLLSNGSFSKIYGKLLSNKKQIKTETTDGIWIKYNQEEADDYDDENNELENEVSSTKTPEYIKLYNSLQGYNTGWCTAGSSETAKEQLKEGDFHVYYSKDNKGEYKIPRLAIRMSEDEIAEIRGIAENQNIEPNMEYILEEKLKEFPDAQKYKKKVSNMKRLTKIYNKHLSKEKLTNEELIFIYGFENNYDYDYDYDYDKSRIEGFGYCEDPRIDEIITSRNIVDDYNIIIRNSSLLEGLDFSRLTTAKGLIIPDSFEGDLDLSGLTTAEGLIIPDSFEGNLDLSGLTTAEGLIIPEIFKGSLNLNGLTTAKGIALPESIEGSLQLSRLTTIEGLILPKTIGKELYLDGLLKVDGLVLPEYIGGSLVMKRLIEAKNMTFPEKIEGGLYLEHLKKIETTDFPEYIGGSLLLNRLKEAKNIVLPEKIEGDLDLGSLENAKSIGMPEYVGGRFELSDLNNTTGLNLPEYVGGSLNIYGIKVFKEIILKIKNINRVRVYQTNESYSLEKIREIQKCHTEKEYINKPKSRGFVNGIYLTISVLSLCILAFVISLLIIR